ncbi:N-acyl-D-amino-acid deacylase family protein [Oceanobacillus jeddahense]|uniref:D-aminoacylase n=1 Tax=Oceanobacillus jeddahense TaxID=1462527 RepID=A0ABY5JZK4_9BACI|nr:D-aminoacylase [Oceanobacillus jeddahense]UUI04267.1 D-aminoacylase [Oceanobacillus jeddahense]
MFDLIIKNGQLFDGTGNPATKLDIGIKNGKIAKINKLDHSNAKNVIDAQGLAISPGFIDTHSHSDLLCTDPETHKIRLLQGITTELHGQDGISIAPVNTETKPLWQEQLKGLDGDIGDWPWESVDDYLTHLENTPIAGNVLHLVPHGNVRTLIMGFEERTATAEELKQITKLVEKGMEEGAIGVSSGLIYPPNVYSNKEELIALCKGAAKYDGVFVVHIRNESNKSLEALDEVVDVARQTGIRLHVSHFKVAGQYNRDKFKKFLENIDKAREEGIEVTFDQYPYTAGSTVFHSILPPWMHSGGTKKMLERLQDPSVRTQIQEDFKANDSYENWVFNCGWENIFINTIATEKNKIFEGKNMEEIAKLRGQDPSEAALDLLVEEEGAITMTIHWGMEEDLIYGMKHPVQMVGSDGIFGSKPHPRLYGTFARVLGKYARDEGIFTLSEGIRKMTGAAAQLLRLKDRGYLREGYWADIVIFNPNTIKDTATYEDPIQLPSGISYVLVNGNLTVEEGKFTNETAGQVIRRDSQYSKITL